MKSYYLIKLARAAAEKMPSAARYKKTHLSNKSQMTYILLAQCTCQKITTPTVSSCTLRSEQDLENCHRAVAFMDLPVPMSVKYRHSAAVFLVKSRTEKKLLWLAECHLMLAQQKSHWRKTVAENMLVKTKRLISTLKQPFLLWTEPQPSCIVHGSAVRIAS